MTGKFLQNVTTPLQAVTNMESMFSICAQIPAISNHIKLFQDSVLIRSRNSEAVTDVLRKEDNFNAADRTTVAAAVQICLVTSVGPQGAHIVARRGLRGIRHSIPI